MVGLLPVAPSDHCCYLLHSEKDSRRCYIGYTVDPQRRLRQHNREIEGGANKTKKYAPWKLVRVVSGFYDKGSALRFEWHWQHTLQRQTSLAGRLRALDVLLARGDGSLPWPQLVVTSL